MQNVQTALRFSVANQEPESRYGIAWTIPYSGTGASDQELLDFGNVPQAAGFTCHSIYIDSSQSTAPVQVYFPATTQLIQVKAGTQGSYPVFAPGPDSNAELKLYVTVNTAAPCSVSIILLNYETEYITWAAM